MKKENVSNDFLSKSIIFLCVILWRRSRFKFSWWNICSFCIQHPKWLFTNHHHHYGSSENFPQTLYCWNKIKMVVKKKRNSSAKNASKKKWAFEAKPLKCHFAEVRHYIQDQRNMMLKSVWNKKLISSETHFWCSRFRNWWVSWIRVLAFPEITNHS